MKRRLAAFAIFASQFALLAHANDALDAKVRAYVPVVSLAKVCDIRINDATSGDHRAMLEAVKSDPNANKLAFRLHYETMTAYIAQVGIGDVPTGSTEYKTIFAVGATLFVATFIMNLIAIRLVRKYREVYE